jgi:hypothetical protein
MSSTGSRFRSRSRAGDKHIQWCKPSGGTADVTASATASAPGEMNSFPRSFVESAKIQKLFLSPRLCYNACVKPRYACGVRALGRGREMGTTPVAQKH